MHATRTPDIFATRSRGGGSKGGGTTADVGTADVGGDDEVPTEKKEKEDRNYVKAVCQCTPPAVIRVSPKTLERRNIMCGDCTENFGPEQSARHRWSIWPDNPRGPRRSPSSGNRPGHDTRIAQLRRSGGSGGGGGGGTPAAAPTSAALPTSSGCSALSSSQHEIDRNE